jgi:polysaccharide export outer membrane protein
MIFNNNSPWIAGLVLSGALGVPLGGGLPVHAQSDVEPLLPQEESSSPASENIEETIAPESPSETFNPDIPVRQNLPNRPLPQTEVFGISAAYRLGIGDLININVFAADDYSTQVLVLQDGTINLPRVGPVFVLGQTIQEAENTVASQYRQFIRQPMVTISPITLRPIRIAIAGEVKRPGSYTLDRGSNIDDADNNSPPFPTLTEAISQAGGITSKANIREIQIRRYVAYNETEISTFNLWDLIQAGDLRQDVVLQSGDEVIIPTAVNNSPGEVSELASASFAPSAIKVYIAGEVENPGILEVPLDTALNEAILNAGGFNSRANRTVVDLVRVNPDGTVSQRQIEVDFSQDVNEEVNPMLADQDIIVVNRSGLTRFGDSVGIVLSPVTQILNTVLGLDRLLFD